MGGWTIGGAFGVPTVCRVCAVGRARCLARVGNFTERGPAVRAWFVVCAQRAKAAAYASEFEKGLFMSVLFLEYPKCSTCKKAKKWLDEHGVEYVDRDITTENPTAAELAEWHARSGLPLRRLFNTSGMKYRELGIKAKLDAGMTDAECFDLLATDGMLVKRPLLVGDDFVIPGFKEQAWAEALGLNL